ncbi:MAG: hypothetical protein KBT03_02975, partial [Bacteroidales bacterium]|nr:hypothetical protein [Candidatus Scybalousia scybalohippi]
KINNAAIKLIIISPGYNKVLKIEALKENIFPIPASKLRISKDRFPFDFIISATECNETNDIHNIINKEMIV